VDSEAAAAHRALASIWGRLTETIEGARFEERGDLVVAITPGFPFPQCNGAWVTEDSAGAVAELPGVLAEVVASGARPWLQTRSAHVETPALARELGLTHVERVPAMLVRPAELAQPDVSVEVALIDEREVGAAVAMLAEAFEAPEDVLARFAAACASVPESRWYVGRSDGALVSTALGITLGDATGIFNVATPRENRRRGYGAALTARAVRDGFAAGSTFAFLQSSALGLSVYRSLGFREVEEYTLHTHPEP
jgi:hypothetical protein